MDKPLVTITYKTANGNRICVEVSTPVKELLEQSDRQIRSQRRQDRRHLDFTVRTDESFSDFLLPAYEDTADLLIKMERDAKLHEAISKLTEAQRRRLRLHFFEGHSYSQIARLEGVAYQTIVDAIKQALKRLQNFYRR
ncbi:hypothetical protein A7X67_08955 [Clostridium sp. W14A]|nr:hypothetical protein A7X67_08955 [Clostridium sp. W14A]